MIINELLLKWYDENGRDLPWRNTKNPYYVWVSEIVLQQTKVNQGLNYYLNFINHFPTIKILAESDLDKVLHVWQGLGYYSRARNMHFTAKFIINECKGVFPDTYSELLKLKGVGSYTAAAIASIISNEKVAVLDGNVYRLYSRLYLVEEAINTTKGRKTFSALAEKVLFKDDPGKFNQAIMDFGAMQCVPKNPNCDSCILNTYCLAFEKNMVSKLPVKEGKTKVRNRFFNYVILLDGDSVYIKNRKDKDIWQGLYEFPLFEYDSDEQDVLLSNDMNVLVKSPVEILYVSEKKIHILSHQKIFAKAFCLKAELKEDKKKQFIKIPYKELTDYPFPKLLTNFIDEFLSFIRETT